MWENVKLDYPVSPPMSKEMYMHRLNFDEFFKSE
jgi:hypothetical protein